MPATTSGAFSPADADVPVDEDVLVLVEGAAPAGWGPLVELVLLAEHPRRVNTERQATRFIAVLHQHSGLTNAAIVK